MSDPIEFLRARLDEDEAIARAGMDGAPNGSGRWHAAYSRDDLDPTRWTVATAPLSDVPLAGPDLAPGAAHHIARWDPARVLVEIEAKRRILRVQEIAIEYGQRATPTCPFNPRCACNPCIVVRALAQPYAGHPDYDPAWRVEDHPDGATSTAPDRP